MRHVMLDLETLGRRPGCAVLSVAMVEFDHTGLGGYTYCAVKSPRGHVDMDTIEWWMGQPDEVRDVFRVKSKVSHDDMVAQVSGFFTSVKARYLWCHATFDEPILKAAFGGVPVPWDFRDVRDLRTLVMLAKVVNFKSKEKLTHHDALGDARWQAEQAVACFKKMGFKG